MIPDFEILKRDSDFFGIKVAKITEDLLNLDKVQIELELKKLFDADVELAYYYSSLPLPEDFTSQFYNSILVDERIKLKKPLNRNSHIHHNISLYKDSYPGADLIALAQLAGHHTRFYLDPNISKEKYNELFKNWTVKSVQKEMASHVLVYKMDSKIVGFATIKKDVEYPQIALLAVDPMVEGKGVAFALFLSIEKILLDEGYEFVTGVTHAKNRKALALYYRLGCQGNKIEYGYHFWRKK
ncbi:GNAT family N-acetyltransferase [Salinimicrobium sp. CAU 1759]